MAVQNKNKFLDQGSGYQLCCVSLPIPKKSSESCATFLSNVAYRQTSRQNINAFENIASVGGDIKILNIYDLYNNFYIIFVHQNNVDIYKWYNKTF